MTTKEATNVANSGGHTHAVFIGNLAWKTTDEDLKQFVEIIGNVVSASVQRHSDTLRSKGWGLIEFLDDESAQQAITRLNSTLLNGRQVYVRLDQSLQDPKVNGVGLFVGNIPWDTTKESLMELFAPFSPTDCVIATNMMGKSRGFSILLFDSAEDAQRAINAMHLKDFNGRALECHVDNGRQRKKTNIRVVKSKLFVGNLASELDEDAVASIFAEAGTVVSVSIKRCEEAEKNWGIVKFSSDDEAAHAVKRFHGSVRPGSSLPWVVRFDRK